MDLPTNDREFGQRISKGTFADDNSSATILRPSRRNIPCRAVMDISAGWGGAPFAASDVVVSGGGGRLYTTRKGTSFCVASCCANSNAQLSTVRISRIIQ